MTSRSRSADWKALAVCLTTALLLTGCTASSGGFPHRSENEQADLKALEIEFAKPARITEHYKLKAAGERQDDRDAIVSGRMALIDANYKAFVRDFVIEKERGDTATDVTVIGLNSAGALIVPSSTTRILAGIAAAITGSKASFDKNFYYEQTAKALYTAMNAQRKEVRARILDGLKHSVSVYPLSQALTDLDDYYFAGTFLGALQAIQRDAGVKDANAQDLIDDVRGFVKVPTPPATKKQIRELADAIQNKVEKLKPDDRKALILAVDKDARAESWASVEAAKNWLEDRQGANDRDVTKVDAMYQVFKKANLVGQ